MFKYAALMLIGATALASPSLARDGTGYLGIEGGVLVPRHTDIDIYDDNGDLIGRDFLEINHKSGWDADLVAGYDFGTVRAEVEVGHKRAGIEKLTVRDPFDTVDTTDTFDGDGRLKVNSLMANVLLDFGNEDGVSFYVGGGLGAARVKYRLLPDDVADSDLDLRFSDRALAGQIVAGVRTMVSNTIDIGLKYRYFRTRKLEFDRNDDDFVDQARGRFTSHSLLASVIFNFGGPAAPVYVEPVVAPPPPPPATQTCPDGSVILATEACPPPPAPVYVPPPPPEPTPERG
jgi:opacity protein-like surface antigen